MTEISQTDPFESKKQRYFFTIAREVGPIMLPLHRSQQLRRDLNSEGQDWRNVGEHSLVAVARVRELAILLNLPDDIRKDLELSAALHDSYKRQEVKFVSNEGASYRSYLRYSNIQAEEIKKVGLKKRVINILSGVGIDSFERLNKLIEKTEWTEEEIATTILSYVDCYTSNDSWVVPANNGENDIDRRAFLSSKKPFGLVLDADVKAKGVFNNETLFEAQRRIEHSIEKRLSDLINNQLGIRIEPLNLPEVVDQKIIENIDKV